MRTTVRDLLRDLTDRAAIQPQILDAHVGVDFNTPMSNEGVRFDPGVNAVFLHLNREVSFPDGHED